MAIQNNPFAQKKAVILESLSRPTEQYTDASPKGSIDIPIQGLIEEINDCQGLVTTSSCSGRISVFVEGSGKTTKGHGGKWLFVSHKPLSTPEHSENEQDLAFHTIPSTWYDVFGLSPSRTQLGLLDADSCYIHFKFEPLILHVLTAGAAEASSLLSCAQQAGFRESGASNVPHTSSVSGDDSINIAIRTAGLSFDNIIGFRAETTTTSSESHQSLVSENYLDMLVSISNNKFKINTERISRFRSLLREKFQPSSSPKSLNPDWEDRLERRERKRAQGLQRQQELKANTPNK